MSIPWQDHLLPDNTLDLTDYVEDDARVTATTNLMRPLGPSIWMVDPDHVETPTIVVGLQAAGGAWVWNPQEWSKTLATELQARCGGVRHLVIPNSHSVDVENLQIWSKAYPKAKIYGPPDIEVEDLPFVVDFLLTDDPKLDYVLDVDQVLFRGSATVECMFFHRMSGTLLVSDWIQSKEIDAQSWWSYVSSPPSEDSKYCTPSSVQWSCWWHNEPELLRKPLDKVLQKWQPTQIVLGTQTTVIGEYATDLLERVFSWVPQVEELPEASAVDRSLLEPFRGVYTTGEGASAAVVSAQG